MSSHVDPDEILRDDVLRDPYPFFKRLRTYDPVHWSSPTQAWYITRYADVAELLSDPRLRAASSQEFLDRLTPAERSVIEPVERFFERWMVFADPPYQLRLRRPLQSAFTPAVVRGLLPTITRHAEAAVGAFPSAGGDLVADLARPFATAVICDLLGVAESERNQLMSWADALVAYLGSAGVDLDRAAAASAAVDALSAYVAEVVLSRNAGLICTAFEEALATGDFSTDEVAATFAQLLTGGIEPVSTAIAVAVTALAADPDQHRAVRAGEIPYAHVANEAIRFDPPFHFAPRRTVAEVVVGGRAIPAGSRVVLVLASANRDERQFPSADRFDARRGPTRHLAFGRGAHYCLGGVLARLEIEEMLKALDRARPGLRLEPETVRRAPSFGSTVLEPTPVFV